MGVNRFTRTQDTTYQPRTLQELMLVPAYKRKQHDDINTGIMGYETELSQVPGLDVHEEKLMEEQKKLYDKMLAQRDKLESEGFNQSSKSNFIRLNKEYQSAMGPEGSIGKIKLAKAAYDQERENALKQAVTMGYSPEEALINWEKHKGKYAEEFQRTGQVKPIDSLLPPKYYDVVKETQNLLKDAGYSVEMLYNDLGTSNIVQDAQGNYVVTTKGYKKFGDNGEQIQKALDQMTKQILNPNSDIGKSLRFQNKTPEQALSEIIGLGGVYYKSELDKGSGRMISNYSANEAATAGGIPVISTKLQGYKFADVDPDSIVARVGAFNNATFDKSGNLDFNSGKYKTFEEKIDAYKKGGYMVWKDDKTGQWKAASKAVYNAGVGQEIRPFTIAKDWNHRKSELDAIRKENPQLSGLNDKQLIDRINLFKEDLDANYLSADVISGSSYEWYSDRLFGSQTGSGEHSVGTLRDREITLDGQQYTYDKVADELGYNNYSEFREKGQPIVQDYIPSRGQYRATAIDKDGNPVNMFVEAEPQLKILTQKTQESVTAIAQGKSFAELTPGYDAETQQNVYFYLVNDFVDPKIVSTTVPVKNAGELPPLTKDNSYPLDAVKAAEYNALYVNPLFNSISGVDKTNK